MFQNAFQQDPGAERLLHEIHRACLHGMNGDVDIPVCVKKDDRKVDPATRHFGLELHPRHAGHHQVGDQATRLAVLKGVKELASRGKGLARLIDGFEYPAQCIAHAGVVVDDEDGGLSGCHLLQHLRREA